MLLPQGEYSGPESSQKRERGSEVATFSKARGLVLTKRVSNTKRPFYQYNSTKDNFDREPYPDVDQPARESNKLTHFRTSSHYFNIETGRLELTRRLKVHRICCIFCSTDERDARKFSELYLRTHLNPDPSSKTTTTSY